jgi:hypothetical protein
MHFDQLLGTALADKLRGRTEELLELDDSSMEPRHEPPPKRGA